MTDSLFNAELRDCARINEIQEQRAPVAQERELDEHDLRVAQAEWEAEQRETSRDEQAYHNACDQGHDWDDYDPVDLYGAEWDNHAVREWD